MATETVSLPHERTSLAITASIEAESLARSLKTLVGARNELSDHTDCEAISLLCTRIVRLARINVELLDGGFDTPLEKLRDEIEVGHG